MAYIIPAVIPSDIHDLREHLEKVVGEVKEVQIDVLDGKLTRTPSWPYKKRDDVYFAHILEEEEGLPFWQEVDFEIDMMVYDPEEEAKQWIAAGATRLIIHSSSKNPVEAIQSLRAEFPKGEEIGIELGIALDPETPLEFVKEVAEDVEVIQVMGIDRIGYQGEAFNTDTIEKVRELRKLYPNHGIAVDGGVNVETAHELVLAGADRLVVGSALFHSENIHEAIREFEAI